MKPLAGLLLAAAIVVAALVAGRRRRRTRLAAFRARWGQPVDRARDLEAIAAYHYSVAATDPGTGLDDRTWADLNLDAIFAVIDRAESRAGQQALYHRLRATPPDAHLGAFEALIGRFETDAAAREGAAAALGDMPGVSARDVWDLTEPGAIDSVGWHALFPVLAVGELACAVAILFWPPALLFGAAGLVVIILLRAKAGRRLREAVQGFRQIGPLVSSARRLSAIGFHDADAIVGSLARDVAALTRLARIASWVGRDTAAAAAGELGGLVVEYLNLILALDANALFFGARELRARAAELRRTVAAVGEIDAALSVASYRAGTSGWTRPIVRPAGSPIKLGGIRHPLLPDAVPNSVTLAPPHGMIVTGSNMSGKSTFLRTIGASVVLAQTINTCLADAFEAPRVRVRSCIGRADDPATGRSYYLVEVDAVLDLVRAAAGADPHLFLFDELFRGTNAVERIAAGEAVLAALVASPAPGAPPRHITIAATHDRALVDLLADSYAAFHFADGVDDTGLSFDYQLRPGPSTTRNAIALLKIRQAPASLVERAYASAEVLDRT